MTTGAHLRSDAPIAPPRARGRAASDLLRLLPYLLPYRTRWIAMVAVAMTSLVATLAIPLMTKAVIDGPVRQRDQNGLWLVGGVAVAFGVAEATLWFVRRWLVARATMGVEADIRKDLYARLQILPMSFHGRWQSGQLLSRIMNDLNAIRRFLSFGLIFLVLNGLQIIVVTALLLAMYWPLGVVVLLSVVPVTATVLHFERAFTALSRQAQDQAGEIATHVEESALGLRAVKSFGREDYVYRRFDTQASQLFDTQMRKVAVSAKFWSLGFLLSMTQESMTAANRIAEIFDAPTEITDGPRAEPPAGGRLVMDDVGFRFADAGPGEWALRHVSITVEPGQTLALVGPTGSGKSTLTALLPRLYDVTEGRVLIDGIDIRELSRSALRRVVAVAFEDPILFSMSVIENLTLGRPSDDPAGDAEIAEAIEVAAAQFVYELPFGLQTRIGEQGMSLSGGQRQRLSLARAILAAPKILVLDDTLSALDVHTEAAVTGALRRILRGVTGSGVTGIVVAHRASTVQLADKVALVDVVDGAGTITAVGTHEELLATVPRYRYLLAADDEIDDGCEPRPDWEGDGDRARVERVYAEEREEQAAARLPADYVIVEGGLG
ncbi:MAG: ABC transporter ATP-binding protein [Mycobacteriaceae bacterium]|nr:ABC transporter ATP-binding protein [Mycobacteriaceae bacterium]